MLPTRFSTLSMVLFTLPNFLHAWFCAKFLPTRSLCMQLVWLLATQALDMVVEDGRSAKERFMHV